MFSLVFSTQFQLTLTLHSAKKRTLQGRGKVHNSLSLSHTHTLSLSHTHIYTHTNTLIQTHRQTHCFLPFLSASLLFFLCSFFLFLFLLYLSFSLFLYSLSFYLCSFSFYPFLSSLAFLCSLTLSPTLSPPRANTHTFSLFLPYISFQFLQSFSLSLSLFLSFSFLFLKSFLNKRL